MSDSNQGIDESVVRMFPGGLLRTKVEPPPRPAMTDETAQRLLATMERVERKLDFIFDGHVLIDEKWVSVARLMQESEGCSGR